MTSDADSSAQLLTPEFTRQLDRLDVLSRKILRGRMQGERRSKKRGQSVEFADYRNYVAGDDLRFIDWNLYARLNKLFLRLFQEEEDLSVLVALDTSASMGFGDPNKLDFARRLAAALGYLGLVHDNRVSVYAFTDRLDDWIGDLRGRRPLPRMLRFLQRQEAETDERAGDLAHVCKRLALVQQRPGVVILISDLLDKGDLNQALRYLGGPRHDVYVLQVLAPQEVDPPRGGLAGDLRLRDAEDGTTAEVSISAPLIKRYKQNLEDHCRHVRDQCTRRGILHLMTRTDTPVEDVVLRYLRRRGVVG